MRKRAFDAFEYISIIDATFPHIAAAAGDGYAA